MSLTRKYTFIPNKEIFPNQWSAEIDQLCAFLSGTLAGRLILNIHHAVNPALYVNSVDGTILIDFKVNNISKFQLLKNLQLNSLITDVAPFSVADTQKIVNLNVQYLDDLPITAFKTANKFVEWYIPFVFNGTPVINDISELHWIVPAGTTMTLTEFHVSVFRSFAEGIPSSDAEVTIELQKNGVTISSILLNDSVAINWVKTNVINVAIAENDVITVKVINTVGTLPASNIECRAKFKQKLIS